MSERASVVFPDWRGPDKSTIFVCRSALIWRVSVRLSEDVFNTVDAMPTILPPCENQGNEFHMHVKLSELLSVRIDVLPGLGEEDGLGH